MAILLVCHTASGELQLELILIWEILPSYVIPKA